MAWVASGKIHAIAQPQQVSARFTKREFVLELADNPRYPQHVQFQLTGARCDAIDDFSIGDRIEVEFSLRGREWTSPRGEVKYFNSLEVSAIRPAGALPASRPGEDDPPLPDAPPPDLSDDDIPF
jgi:hypothetical protein